MNTMENTSKPKLIYGKYFEDQVIAIKDIDRKTNAPIVITGKVFEYERRDIRKSDKTLLIISLTDYSDSIKVKLFIEKRHTAFYEERIMCGVCLKIRGSIVFGSYDKELNMQRVTGVIVEPSFTGMRKDTFPQKRVELHCHTKMSAMDGAVDARDLIDIVNITLHLLLVHPVTCFIMQPLPMNHSISFS